MNKCRIINDRRMKSLGKKLLQKARELLATDGDFDDMLSVEVNLLQGEPYIVVKTVLRRKGAPPVTNATA